MEFVVTLAAVVVAASFLLFFRHRSRTRKGKAPDYVCTHCGEMDCICHPTDELNRP